MVVSRKFKLVSGSLAATVALGAGAAIASESPSREVEFDDTVAMLELTTSTTTTSLGEFTSIALDEADDSFASMESEDSPESEDSDD